MAANARTHTRLHDNLNNMIRGTDNIDELEGFICAVTATRAGTNAKQTSTSRVMYDHNTESSLRTTVMIKIRRRINHLRREQQSPDINNNAQHRQPYHHTNIRLK